MKLKEYIDNVEFVKNHLMFLPKFNPILIGKDDSDDQISLRTNAITWEEQNIHEYLRVSHYRPKIIFAIKIIKNIDILNISFEDTNVFVAPPKYLEEITILKSGINSTYITIPGAKFIFVYGTLFNLAYDLLKENEKENKYKKGILIKDAIEDYLINYDIDNNGLIPVLTHQFSYSAGIYKKRENDNKIEKYDYKTKPEPFDYLASSLADIFYHTVFQLSELGETKTHIKKCKSCKKILFTKNNNRDYCQYPNEKIKQRPISCELGLSERPEREKKFKKQIAREGVEYSKYYSMAKAKNKIKTQRLIKATEYHPYRLELRLKGFNKIRQL